MEKRFIESSGLWELTAAEGCKLVAVAEPDAAIGSFLRCNQDSIPLYMERPKAEISGISKAQRDEMTARLVRERYTDSEEFAIQRKMLNALMQPMTLCDEDSADNAAEEYAAYNAYVEECKARAKDPALYATPIPLIEEGSEEESGETPEPETE